MASELTKEEQEKKLIEEFDKLNAEEKDKWQREIDLLERRTETNIEDVELEKGGAIATYSSLAQEGRIKISDLFDKLKGLGEPENWGKKEFVESDDIIYEVFEIMTPNPHFTKEWFKNNPKRFSQNDIERLIFRARAVQLKKEIQEQKRIRDVTSFRAKPGGTKLR